MGLFDSLVTQVSGALSGNNSSSHGGMLEAVMTIINSPQIGGIQGLITLFQNKGLGDAMASWISTGQNLPISAEQIQHVLGNEHVQAVAQKLGISSTDAAQGLATMLPQIIDHLTPNGSVPHGGLLEEGLSLLKGKF
ncbi:MAG TPA: YidB family protein [Gallionellaceae bacterium]